MLNTDLIEVVNSGEAWALVGSGVSTDSGVPGWRRLIEASLDVLDTTPRAAIIADVRYIDSLAREQYPRALQRIDALAGRDPLEAAVRNVLARTVTPGKLARHVASWPFRGYITSNYDGLLERALGQVDPGWIAVGNREEELRKLSGGARRLVWHFHGAAELDGTRTQLVLTESDYDTIYGGGSSPLLDQLRAYFRLHRLVIFGFGFRDEELVRLMRITSRYCTPARPAFAFLGGVDEATRFEMRERFNVEVVPYPLVGGSHAALDSLLDTYGSFTLKRNLRYSRPTQPVPSYDPETTGLMMYNDLVLKGGARTPDDAVDALLRARLLSLLMYQGPLGVGPLTSDLSARAALLGEAAAGANTHHDRVLAGLDALQREGLIVAESVGAGAQYGLTSLGRRRLQEQAARATVLSEQFSSSLLARARALGAQDAAAARIATAAEGFVKDCVEKRALGVAMARGTTTDTQRFHIVALLQALPEFLGQLETADEAGLLVALVQQILAERNPADLKYIGVALQARFGLHLLGYDPAALRRRLEELAETLFLIDSSTLIYALARGSSGHDAAKSLLARLTTIGAPVATTDLLAVEVAEHARWAQDHVNPGDPLGYGTFAAVTGGSRYRPNAFLSGFLSEVADGSKTDFNSYLDEISHDSMGHTATDAVFEAACQQIGVDCIPIAQWTGFDQTLWGEIQSQESEIETRRRAAETYRHARQVQAEAEALLIIQGLRDHRLSIEGRAVAHAYFVSPTRLLDDVAGPGSAITMRAEAVLQWVNTVTACPLDELGTLTSALISELDERGLTILDRRRLLAVFSPLIDASKERLTEELEANRALVAEVYGNEGLRSFSDLRAIDIPIAVGSYYRQKAEELERQLAIERETREALAERKRLDEKARDELARLQAAEKQRQARQRSKRRVAGQKRHK